MGNRFASGVYTITHTESGRVYVGSSKNIPHRWRGHIRALKSGTHHSVHLQRAWSKYGAEAFAFAQILLCDACNLQDYEQRLIDDMQPAFNMSKSATSPVQRGQKLPKEWADKIADSIRGRYAAGFKIFHPPRSEDYRAEVSKASRQRWINPEQRAKTVLAMQKSMTPEECAKKSSRTVTLWAQPEYRERAVASRKGNAYNKGYKCTPEQVQNRRKAARISNMKRNYGEGWVSEYTRRYPEFVGDVHGK